MCVLEECKQKSERLEFCLEQMFEQELKLIYNQLGREFENTKVKLKNKTKFNKRHISNKTNNFLNLKRLLIIEVIKSQRLILLIFSEESLLSFHYLRFDLQGVFLNTHFNSTSTLQRAQLRSGERRGRGGLARVSGILHVRGRGSLMKLGFRLSGSRVSEPLTTRTAPT